MHHVFPYFVFTLRIWLPRVAKAGLVEALRMCFAAVLVAALTVAGVKRSKCLCSAEEPMTESFLCLSHVLQLRGSNTWEGLLVPRRRTVSATLYNA